MYNNTFTCILNNSYILLYSKYITCVCFNVKMLFIYTISMCCVVRHLMYRRKNIMYLTINIAWYNVYTFKSALENRHFWHIHSQDNFICKYFTQTLSRQFLGITVSVLPMFWEFPRPKQACICTYNFLGDLGTIWTLANWIVNTMSAWYQLICFI